MLSEHGGVSRQGMCAGVLYSAKNANRCNYWLLLHGVCVRASTFVYCICVVETTGRPETPLPRYDFAIMYMQVRK